ncbi:lipopolysaccharide biosynthesis protein [Ferrimonas marina]|uniref:Membrane protein involved in the export of O-antigen and teichoic acid n=1 Tax=Ferrimonas marina TaxID=299255 RepID=A0A1M5RT82_9GAMM|nr:hypothetical protein [Ferrimonas marina]SHH29023.1 Membrane protein involved in the export of O-antigen and teichoic acid [Ferrimonas marina]
MSASLGQIGGYTLLTVLQKGIGLLVLPVTASHLSLATFGVLEGLVLLMVLLCLLEASAGALPRLFVEARGQTGVLLGAALQLSTLAAILLALAAWWVLQGLGLPLYGSVTPLQATLVALVVALNVLLQPLLIWLRIRERMGAFARVVLSQCLAQAGTTLTLLQLGWGLDGVLWASVLGHGIALVLALHGCWGQWHWPGRSPRSAVKTPTPSHWHGRILCYQACLVLASLGVFALHGLDRLLLGQWLGPQSLAQLAILFKVAEAVALLFAGAELWWQPKRFQVLKQAQGPHQVVQVHLWMLVGLLALAAMALLSAPWVLPYVLPAEYLDGLGWLPLLMTALLLKLATSVLDLGCYLPARPTGLAWINGASALLALTLYLVLIPALGILGLFVTLNLVYGLRLALCVWLSQRLCPLPYPWRRTALFSTFAVGLLLWQPGVLLALLSGLILAVLLGGQRQSTLGGEA